MDVSFGSLLSVKRNENQKVSSYVKDLVSDFNVKDKNTHDVALFCISKSKWSKLKVEDIFEDISKAVSDFPVHSSPLNKVIEDRNLRVSSFTIIVSDVSETVS